MKIPVNTKHLKFFKSLSSKTRIQILEILGEGPKNIGELANILNISSAITTRHITLLESVGLIESKSVPGKRGTQKLCFLSASDITLCFEKEEKGKEFQSVSIPIGQYTNYNVTSPCGLSSKDNFIGVCDDSRYFSDPLRYYAALIWFHTGWIEYQIPSYVVPYKAIKAIEVSFEICSEFPGYKENWPSDIHFYLNDTFLGLWTSPGDFGGKKGAYTPNWWKAGTQYGLLKTLRITQKGTMIDGIRMSDIALKDIYIQYGKDLSFIISVPPDSNNPGGLNLFGRGFGNYNQDIEVRVEVN